MLPRSSRTAKHAHTAGRMQRGLRTGAPAAVEGDHGDHHAAHEGHKEHMTAHSGPAVGSSARRVVGGEDEGTDWRWQVGLCPGANSWQLGEQYASLPFSDYPVSWVTTGPCPGGRPDAAAAGAYRYHAEPRAWSNP